MQQLSPTLELACDLVRRESVTPLDAGCQELMIERLQKTGFQIQRLPFDDVTNFWAIHGESGPIFCFAGHTDVVPSGPHDQWEYPPFEARLADGYLYGRGAADMKGSLAAMVVACERFLFERPSHEGRIAFLITSDEEGIAVNGTARVVDWLKQNNLIPRWTLVGEPSSDIQCGDVIKNGRRGSLNGELTIFGIQGHVAYPDLAENPIHLVVPALTELCSIVWDEGNPFFPATSFQISNINGGTGATNMIPGTLKLLFNFRFSTAVTDAELKERVEQVLRGYELEYKLNWHLSGQPFLTELGDLVNATVAAINEVTGIDTELSTAGGTSDGRFLAPAGSQVVELGPVNETIHRVNECVKVDDLEALTETYELILQKLLT